MQNLNQIKTKVEITYPCTWSYKIIGVDKDALFKAADAALGGVPFEISESNKSANGKYLSFNIRLKVSSDEQRRQIADELSGSSAIKIVL